MALRVRDVAYALDAVLEHEPTDIFSMPPPGRILASCIEPAEQAAARRVVADDGIRHG